MDCSLSMKVRKKEKKHVTYLIPLQRETERERCVDTFAERQTERDVLN